MPRITSLDPGYTTGMLSLYPEAKDDKDILYRVANNAETTLVQSLPYSGKYIIVNDTGAFPETGLLRLWTPSTSNAELVYYGKKTSTAFTNLIRGFCASRQNQWSSGTIVSNSVMAEHHNVLKDAVINLETNLGTESYPEPESLNGILKYLEVKHVTPKPSFRGFPLRGPSKLTVTFQNFSNLNVIRYLWDFGDGTTSIERNPTHTYLQEGIYTIKLSVITSTGAQGTITKNNYVTVSDDELTPFFYVQPLDSSYPNYSIETATNLGVEPQTFRFVDQSDGKIQQRYWVFGDGSTATILDPNIHTVEHTYQNADNYKPSLLLVLQNETIKTAFIAGDITVI